MKFLLTFQEDSSLIFAAAFARLMEPRGHSIRFLRIIDRNGPDGISDRQLSAYLGDTTPPHIAEDNVTPATFAGHDAVVASRIVAPMREMLASREYRSQRDRPAFVAFQAGIDFTPERGMKNRRNFDAIFLTAEPHRDIFREKFRPRPDQFVSFGHPYFMTPREPDLSARKNIYFFTQAISPLTLSSRRFIVDILATLARRHPDRDVFIKLRHLPDENANHVHKEAFPYPSILEESLDAPPNLKLTACTMAEALDDAAIAITCTSTAVMDAISAGVPAMIYLDYVENYRDIYSGLMRNEFSDSGLIAGIPEIMELRSSRPYPEWMRQHFRGDDLLEEIETAVSWFKAARR